jgi:ElaB/YqjD/DUF883 family membrane-anchored ribosome-binding protein
MARGESRESKQRGQDNGKMPTSISDALQLLDQHAAGQGEQLFNLFGSGFNAIRTLVAAEIAPRIKETIREAAGDHIEGSRNVIGRLDSEIRENPWRVAGGLAVSALFLGYFMGRANKSPLELLNAATRSGNRSKGSSRRETQYS